MRLFANQAASATIKIRTAKRELLAFGMALLLAACGDSHHTRIDTKPATYTIGGSISGLTTGGLVLRNDGADDLALPADAATFQFATPITAGGSYSITPFAQPTGLTCTVNNGVGSNVKANINNIHIVCSAITHTVGGTISGLTGSGLVLQNNSGDDLTIASNAANFEFATAIAYGGGYAVSVLAQPSGQYCSIANNSGTATTSITDVTVTCSQTTLSASVASLALAVNCPSAGGDCIYANAALSGNARQITIINNGSIAAINVSAVPADFPADTSISSNTCSGTLAAAASCAITITPGQNASSACESGIAPTPGTIIVSADNAPTTTINAVVLTYGCIYQQGFIYSIDDTSAITSSIGGKTAALTDTIPGVINPTSSTPDWGVSGVDLGANSYESSPQGANNGSANSAAIIDAFTTNYSAPPYSGSSPLPLTQYAAGLCSTHSIDSAGNMPCAAGTCYTDWHLPAICELGPLGGQCTTSSTNMQEQLFEANPAIATLGFVDNAFYWSSTVWSTVPGWAVWLEYFSSGGSSRALYNRDYHMGVRCSRELTQ